MDNKLTVTEVERFSIHDGPGIRTLVFLKGCPLTCRWCCNPETQSVSPEMMVMRNRCKTCGACVEACSHKANYIDAEGVVRADRNKCIDCGECFDSCIYYARKISGQDYTVQELVDICLKDTVAYKHSGGGVTVSGGEPTLQAENVTRFLKQCKLHRLNTGMETCAYCDWEKLDSITDYLDYVFVDVKNMDSELHKEYTGVPNELILENIKKMSDKGIPLVISIPVIQDFNDSAENIRKTAEFAKGLDTLMRIRLLPYHKLGTTKFDALDREYTLSELETPSNEKIEELREIVKEAGISVTVGY